MQQIPSRATGPSPRSARRRLAGPWPVLALLALVWGCTGLAKHRQAQIAEQEGNWDEAVLHYMELVEREPDHLTYRSSLLRVKMRASQAHFEDGRKFAEAGSLERALLEYRQAVELDPTNQYAATELEKVRQELAARQREESEVRTIEEMKRDAQARLQPPMLEPRSNQPISLEFPSPVEVKDIYRALGDAFGINILFDPNLKDQQIAIELKEVTAQTALEILMRAAQHFYKVLDEHTILIAQDTPQNRRLYEDLVIQTFFLSNSEVKDVMTMLRTLVDAKKIAQNERLNAIIMRDSVDRVKVAERLIESNDKARAEVVVDVELLQVNSQKVRDIGMSLSAYAIGQGFAPGVDLDSEAIGTQIGLSDLANINRNYWMLTLPSFLYTFVKNNTDAQVLAKPQLRISEGEKASLHIGDKVPIPTTTFNTANTVGSNIVPVTSFQYTDIGIKINIEPRVHHNLEVTLKLRVEVSNLAGSVAGSGGVEQPIIGTRTIETVIRLQDGETNFLAGLLRSDEATREDAVPGLSEIPVLGRFFSRNQRQAQRTDVILTMTPHIIRRSDITDADLAPIWVGTEQNLTFRGGSPRVESDVEGPFDEGASAAERVRELIRQRVQELPRGLEEQGAEEVEEGEEAQPPAGIDLAPPAFPEETPPPESPEDEEELEDEPPGGGASLAPDPQDARDELAADEGELGAGRVTPAAYSPAAADAGADGAAAEPTAEAARRSPAVALRLVPGRLEVEPGDEFEIELETTAAKPLSHLPLVLRFDPQVLEVTGWEPGPLLGGEGEVELLAAESEPGRLVLGLSRLGDQPGVTGKGTAAVLRFRARRTGQATLSLLQPKAMGPALERLAPVTASSSRITVRSAEEDGEQAPARREGADA